MKRKTMALLLALSMCLSLLSACGSGNTSTDDKQPESENAVSSTGQQPEESEKPEESEEPKEEEPEESPEPTQEEPKEEEHAGTKLLALLQEEYQNGFVEGERPGHTYFDLSSLGRRAVIYDGVVYLVRTNRIPLGSYDIAAKEYQQSALAGDEFSSGGASCFMDGNFYYVGCTAGSSHGTRMYDGSGSLLNSVQQQYPYEIRGLSFENGILEFDYQDTGSAVLWSYNLEKIADIPAPQREAEHGVKEDVKLNNTLFAADGTVYGQANKQLYRLNTATYKWEDAGEAPSVGILDPFFGKYSTRSDGIYDSLTGERVFEYGELYPVANYEGGLCYFGGDKYLGQRGDEYRWVNLTDLTMSDPLPFPEGKYPTVLNDTYCIYSDSYGWFLWNYNTGEEETIMLFEQ